MSKLEDVLLGPRAKREPRQERPEGTVEGTVQSITADGMKFVLKWWDNGKHEFGPCPWPMSRIEPDHSPGVMAGPTAVGDHGSHDHGPHTHANHDHNETKPVKGDRCLVVFTANGPWVIGWWPK